MKFRFVPSCIEVSSIDACFCYNWKLIFPYQDFCFFTGLRFVFPILPILSPDAFQKSSLVILNVANDPIGSKSKDICDRIFLWAIVPSISLFVPLKKWKLLSVTVHCSQNTDDPSILFYFNLLCIDERIFSFWDGFANVIAYPVLQSKYKFCSWLKTAVATSWVSNHLRKSSMEKKSL